MVSFRGSVAHTLTGRYALVHFNIEGCMDNELPKAMVLKTIDGRHVGFMLLAPNSGESGECVFSLSASSAEVIDSNLGVVLSELKVSGEHKYVVETIKDGYLINIAPIGLPNVQVQLNHQFSGDIVTDIEGRVACIGTAELVEQSA
ncbi:hypothetical protein DC853_24125 [Vibrio parahaemolyticus]|nr:hypothetical protein [Vibrio parahaemolyticus]EGR3471989.1 hypothetical protein [Vibrio parahaemolyticus]EGR3521424.1 hypothetical protein [Vibrio parahaemolyticus]